MTEKNGSGRTSNNNAAKGKNVIAVGSSTTTVRTNRSNSISKSPALSPRLVPSRSPRIRSPGGSVMMVSPLLNSAQHSPLGMVGAVGGPDGGGGRKFSGLPNLPILAATSTTNTTTANNNTVTTPRSRCNSLNSLHSNVSYCSSSHNHNPSVDAAIEVERQRIRDREREETSLTDPAVLKSALKRERSRSLRLAADLARCKSSAVRSQAEAEAQEEGIINGLLRRLDTLQQEKGRIIVELEREEEMLTNTLQKKLNDVRKEKSLLQAQIDKEHRDNTQLKARLYENNKTTDIN